MGHTTVYKVKDLKTGLFMNKHACWDKKGKTWESLGKLKLSLNGHGYYSKSTHYQSANANAVFGDHIKIIEIKIVETEDNMSNLDDFLAKIRRYLAMGQKYGQSFQDLVERIEDQGQNHQFQWVLVANSTWDYNNQCHKGDFAEMLEIIKRLKLKQNKDYKKASTHSNGGAVAFASKQVAMTVRLTMQGKCQGIDIQDYVETDLDEEDGRLV